MDSSRVKGKLNQVWGKLTRNKDAVADGRSQEGRGKAKDRARNIKDATTDKLDDAKDKLT